MKTVALILGLLTACHVRVRPAAAVVDSYAWCLDSTAPDIRCAEAGYVWVDATYTTRYHWHPGYYRRASPRIRDHR